MESGNDYLKRICDEIQNHTVKALYHKFNFIQIDVNNDSDLANYEKDLIVLLFSYLKYYKFITYIITQYIPVPLPTSNEISGKVNILFCVEKECIFINHISSASIEIVIKKLRENNSSLINTNLNEIKTNEEIEACIEIDGFCSALDINKEIKNNEFVRNTIRPIIGYLIRRYFYPTYFFKDHSFFIFDECNSANEQSQINKLSEAFVNYNKSGTDDQKIEKVIKEIRSNNDKSNNFHYMTFDENEFIDLKTVYCNDQSSYYMVIHRKTFYIFLIKKLAYPGKSTTDNKREIEFCQQFSSRYLVCFYGFVKKNDEIVGLVYEYMTNGSLSWFVKNKSSQINEFFTLIAISRIFQGIHFLHSNHLIYRDLKPLNILLDHDNVPYISDFPTIRHPLDDELSENSEYTVDCFSSLYCSPEQYSGEKYSYPSDIYSFGLIIYYLYEKHDMIQNSNDNSPQNTFPNKAEVSLNIQKLFKGCINRDPQKRTSENHILFQIIEEMKSIFNSLDCLLKTKSISEEQFSQFLFEFIIININEPNIINTIKKNIHYVQSLFKPKPMQITPITVLFKNLKIPPEKFINVYFDYFINSENNNDAVSQYKLGCFFYEDEFISRDINKAIHYFTLASKQNHVLAQYWLGIIYSDDKYVSPDKNKAIHYLTLAANQNDSDAQYELGYIYYKNKNESNNMSYAIHYFTLSANQNNPSAQYSLGTIYADGEYISRDIGKAIHYFTLAANQNNPNAQYALGSIYFQTIFNSQDINKAIHYFILAANQNHPFAQYWLGIIYSSDKYVSPDKNKAIHYLTLAANQNDSDSQYELGCIYYLGKYISQDINKSIYYFNLAANQNHYVAQYNLGLIYYENKYVLRNINKSIHYFSLSSKQNYPTAQYTLGMIYYEGKYIPRDIDKAIYYLAISANQNYVNAQNNLANIYYENKHKKLDINKAIHYFDLAASQNDIDSQFKLGCIFYENQYITQDIPKAIYYFTLAANQNHSESQYILGFIYCFNKKIPNDINKGIHYFMLAAEQKHSKSQYILGALFDEGKCILRDVNKAIQYFTLSANQNNKEAQYHLGRIYIDRDINMAVKYLTLASNNNHPESQNELGCIYFKGMFGKPDIDKAIHYLTLAANQNLTISQYNLGYLYYEGKEILRDIEKSIHYFTLAANQGDRESQNYLGIIFYDDKFISRDIVRSIHYFTLAANQNHSYSQYVLGLIYCEGKYVSRDIKKSIQYFTLAANQNDIDSQYNLGIIYYEDKYIAQNINKSIHYLSLAANRNHSDSQYILGCIYYNTSKFKPHNINISIKYLELAANQNNSNAQYTLGIIYLIDKYIQNIKLALKYLHYSSDNNNRQAQSILGDLYFEGKYLEYDLNKAIHFYKEVSSFNNQYAKNNLGVIYRNYMNNKGLAKEYFREAIKKRQDKLSMYNYANMLLDEIELNSTYKGDPNYTEPIKLLFDAALQEFYPSKTLLCLIIILKWKSFNYKTIQSEFKNLGNDSNEFTTEIYYECNKIKFLFGDDKLLKQNYDQYRKINYVYIVNDIQTLNKIEEGHKKSKLNQRMKIKDINSFFYEGLSLDF